MILVYNFLQIIILCFSLPFFLFLLVRRKKNRGRLLKRLGIGLKHELKAIHGQQAEKQTVWIHALSVGEVTSALPLVRSLRKKRRDSLIVFTVSTSSGLKIADEQIREHVDIILNSPLDFYFTVSHFVKTIRPSLFILVETDFWPNWLFNLRSRHIPSMLVNGRISKKSFDSYSRFRLFFKPLFASFSLLSMQTSEDARNMINLGVPAEHVKTLGNLKYDTTRSNLDETLQALKRSLHLPQEKRIWLCGSTHKGEEDILLNVYKQLLLKHNNLFLIIAPRNINRADELIELARQHGFTAGKRSTEETRTSDILLLDTLGELSKCYHFAHFAFIGGSLVAQGGHNPLEPASCSLPIFFGQHMEDFKEIAEELVQYGGGESISNETELFKAIDFILSNPTHYKKMAEGSSKLIKNHMGVTLAHLHEIEKFIPALPDKKKE